MARPRNTIELFHTRYKINPRTQCWEWTANRHAQGYGVWRYKGKQLLAHRFSAEQYIGSIEGKVVCHHCDNPCCVNPSHLFIGTQQDNVSDMMSKGRAAFGANSNSNKLTEQDALDIRADTTTPKKELAKQYKVTYNAIRDIHTRRTWKHI